jgi:hypothetical protein
MGPAVGRWLVKWFAGWFGGSLISVGMIAGLPNHKAIHDYTAGTIVLRGRLAEEKGIELWRFIAAFAIAFAWLLGTFYTILMCGQSCPENQNPMNIEMTREPLRSRSARVKNCYQLHSC